MLKRFEDLVFRLRVPFLAVLALLTVVTGYYAAQLRFDAGFIKQLPTEHPYIETYTAYRDKLPPPNTIIVGLHPRQGTIWTIESMRKLTEVMNVIVSEKDNLETAMRIAPTAINAMPKPNLP